MKLLYPFIIAVLALSCPLLYSKRASQNHYRHLHSGQVNFKLNHRLKPNDLHHNQTIKEFYPVYLQPTKLNFIVQLHNPYKESFFNASYLRRQAQGNKFLGLCNNRDTTIQILDPESKDVLYETSLHQTIQLRILVIKVPSKTFHLVIEKSSSDVFVQESNYDEPPNPYVTLVPQHWAQTSIYLLSITESAPLYKKL